MNWLRKPLSQRFFTVFFAVFSSKEYWESLGVLTALKFTGLLAGSANSWWFVTLPFWLKVLAAATSGACALAFKPAAKPVKGKPMLTIEDFEHDPSDKE